MKIKLNYLLIPLLVVSLMGNVLFYFKIGELEKEIQEISQYKNQSSPVGENENQDQNDNITYKTFSSPKADFTFEYPDTWVYDEKEIEREINNTMASTTFWGFYPNLESGYRNRPPYLEVSSPGYEVVDFCSGGPDTAKGDPYGFTISIFPTNDPKTFITYEQCGVDGGSGDGGYIYWQKGKYFANAIDIDIDDFYFKVNIMICHGSDELEGQKVAQRIAQSIKIK